MTPTTDTLTIRRAGADDRPALQRLAQLDETPELALPALIAEADGRTVAAISLHDGAVAADPFARTVDTVALLQLRAHRLERAASTGVARRLSRLARRPGHGLSARA